RSPLAAPAPSSDPLSLRDALPISARRPRRGGHAMTARLRAVRPDDGNRYDWGGVCLGWRLLELQHMQVRQEWMPAGGAEAPHWQDRKSTRLNSSHVKISYAVFCLK